jgi:hypothetical protein
VLLHLQAAISECKAQTSRCIHLQQQERVGFIENATQQLRSIGHRLLRGAAVQLLQSAAGACTKDDVLCVGDNST